MGFFDFLKRKQRPEKKVIAVDPHDVRFPMPDNTRAVVSGSEKTVEKIDLTITYNLHRNDDVVPAEVRIKDAVASESGLYPHEVLVLDYAPSYFIGDKGPFQGFWWYKYGVSDVSKVLNDLYSRGFLETGSLANTIGGLTAADLKVELKKYGLKASGKKADLVNRLLNEAPIEKLEMSFPRRRYSCTEKGKIALAESAYVPYIHSRMIEDLNIWSLNKIVHASPQAPVRDKIWDYLEKRSAQYLNENSDGAYRNCRRCMSEMLLEENKWEPALSLLTEVWYSDLSGSWNGVDGPYIRAFADTFFPYSSSSAKLPPGISRTLSFYKDRLDMTDDDLRHLFHTKMSTLSRPFHLFTSEECVDIIMCEMQEDVEGLENIYSVAEARFNRIYPKRK